jgi:hypothetical protein
METNCRLGTAIRFQPPRPSRDRGRVAHPVMPALVQSDAEMFADSESRLAS